MAPTVAARQAATPQPLGFRRRKSSPSLPLGASPPPPEQPWLFPLPQPDGPFADLLPLKKLNKQTRR